MTDIRTQQDLIDQHIAGLRENVKAAEQAVNEAHVRFHEAGVKRDEAVAALAEFEASCAPAISGDHPPEPVAAETEAPAKPAKRKRAR
jgi:hypothetical protein